jgi:stress-induced morphogen
MASRTLLQLSRAASRFTTPTISRAAFTSQLPRAQTSFQPQQINYFRKSYSTTPQVEAPDYLDEREAAIFATIKEALQPTKLEVQDVSGGCGSMYALDIVSEQFAGLTVIKQHRLVNKILGEEIKKWHGVQLKTRAP